MMTGIILVNYGAFADTAECIESLKNISDPIMIIVVDNCSPDDSYEKLQLIPDIHLIKSDHNGGFAYGNNIGIRYALKHGCESVLLLNNDTVVTENFLKILKQDLQTHPEAGIAAPKILNYYEKNRIWSAGGTIDWKLFVGHNRHTKEMDNGISEHMEMPFLNGCCLLIRKDVFDQVGLLPEEYFMYYEDLDFCMRVRSKFTLRYNSDAVIYHKISATSRDNSSFQLEWVTRSQLRFMRTYKDQVSKTAYGVSAVNVYGRKMVRILLYLLRFDFERAAAVLRGLRRS